MVAAWVAHRHRSGGRKPPTGHGRPKRRCNSAISTTADSASALFPQRRLYFWTPVVHHPHYSELCALPVFESFMLETHHHPFWIFCSFSGLILCVWVSVSSEPNERQRKDHFSTQWLFRILNVLRRLGRRCPRCPHDGGAHNGTQISSLRDPRFVSAQGWCVWKVCFVPRVYETRGRFFIIKKQ